MQMICINRYLIIVLQIIDNRSELIEVGIGGGQATLPFLKKNCRVTAIEYGKNLADVMGKSRRSIQMLMKQLIEDDDIERLGSKKQGTWILKK